MGYENGDKFYFGNSQWGNVTAKMSQTIQTHNAVSILGTSGNTSNTWIDTQGFDQVAVTLLNDASTGTSVDLQWSHDGATLQGVDAGLIPTASATRRSGITPTKARYLKVSVNNTDAAAHVISTWVYLKT